MATTKSGVIDQVWLARRKELYEAQHPETKQEATRRDNLKQNRTAESAVRDEPSFVDDTAKKTGRGARTVREDVAIGTKLTPAAAEITGLNPRPRNNGHLVRRLFLHRQSCHGRTPSRQSAVRPVPDQVCRRLSRSFA